MGLIYLPKGSISMVNVGKYTIYTMHTWILWDFKMLYLFQGVLLDELEQKGGRIDLGVFFKYDPGDCDIIPLTSNDTS